MTPHNLTDSELLRLYADEFRCSPAVAELANRLDGGSPLAEAEEERNEALQNLEDAYGRISKLEQALEACCDNEKGARAEGRKILAEAP